MNISTLKDTFARMPEIVTLARQAQSTVQELGLDKAAVSLLRFLPARTVTTLSLPLAAASFGAGMVTGAAAAALFTPKRGDELRAMINEQVQHAWSKATGSKKDAFAKPGEEALDELDRGETSARTYRDQRERDKDREIAATSSDGGA